MTVGENIIGLQWVTCDDDLPDLLEIHQRHRAMSRIESRFDDPGYLPALLAFARALEAYDSRLAAKDATPCT
jgi:hypothetical protein